LEELIKLDSYPVRRLLYKLLQDKTTHKNILFASDSYESYGNEYKNSSQMTENVLLGFASCNIQPRVYKAAVIQTERTRKRAEVFTPAWIVNLMNNHCDSEWFGRKNVFNCPEGKTWRVTSNKISFPLQKDWKSYIDSKRLEITCGEAPYIVSRYDTSTGEIIPVECRTGILDRKMRIINENVKDETEWFHWTLRAFQSVYGYEFQGDNLLIARINLLYTFADYVEARWNRKATQKELRKFINVICWNFWQMNGLNCTPPCEISEKENLQKQTVYCKIYDWKSDTSRLFKEIKKDDREIKFDFVIGNPPYQKGRQGKSNTALPVYHHFMEASYKIAGAVELIHPARFLFNAGRTPKQWNQKMLKDSHLKVLMYEENADKIFRNTKIKGGVVITYRDELKSYGAIETFTAYPQLNTILNKIKPFICDTSLASLAFVASKFNTDNLFNDYPQYQGHERRMSSNVLSFECFSDVPRNDDIMIYGIWKNHRKFRYISGKYVDTSDVNIKKYKIVMPKADGNGAFGSTITMPEILPPNSGFTHTFLGMGGFSSENEANAVLKYIKTRFARALLGILKITQDINADKWIYVPVQNFGSDSDIDWKVSIYEIDKQLYKKYAFTTEEINFIEKNVKKMS